MRLRVLSDEQVREAKRLKRDGVSKRALAKMFGVGESTIWDNVYSQKKRVRISIFTKKEPRTGAKCKKCEIFLTRELKQPQYIPLNYQILDTCITCYLNENGLKYKDLL